MHPASGRATRPRTVELIGLRFRNPVGLGAGFDKDGLAIGGWAALGFGFVELGTVTPRPQPGNPRPRLFRLPRDRALVNRMGFNNAGAEALAGRIADARPRLPEGFVVGVNIGRNRDGDDRRLSDGGARGRRGGRLPRHQCQLAEHARPARPRGPGAASRAARHGPRGRAVSAAPRQALARPTHNRRAEIVRASDRCRRAAWSSATRRRSGSASVRPPAERAAASPAPR